MNTWQKIALAGLLLIASRAHAEDIVHYYYTDPQGTVLAKTDATGNVIASYDYAPYGSQALGTPPNGPGYTGHVNDPETGLVYMQARYYDPAVGRFLSTDPVGPSPGDLFNFNRYDYANNNPIKNVDPNGKQEEAVEPESPDNGVDPLGHPLEGPNVGTASPFIRMQGESSSDFSSRQQYAFQRMDSTPEKNAADDAKQKDRAKYTNYKSGGVFSKKTQSDTAKRADYKCEYCQVPTTPAKQSVRGVTPPGNEGQTDHNDPKSNGGTNSPDNAVHSCRSCNLKYGNTPKPHPRMTQTPNDGGS